MASVKFPKEYIDLLAAVAGEEGKTVKEFITDAVAAYMVREKAKEKGEPAPPEAQPKKRRKTAPQEAEGPNDKDRQEVDT